MKSDTGPIENDRIYRLDRLTWVGAILILHKRVFNDKYDPIMVSCHYCFLKQGFVISGMPDEVRILYLFSVYLFIF
jgi:hypothetical protein